MILKKWEQLPLEMQNDEVKIYFDELQTKKVSLFLKRLFDVFTAFIILILLLPLMAIISILIKFDSPGKVIFKQKRITRYGREFYIYKFRTMVENAEKFGSQVTVDNDNRITGVGRALRKYRLDEFPQLINILKGEMSFVGARPEVQKYVERYTDDMRATLLLPAGVTSLASICYKDEEKLLSETVNVDETYMELILPQKMKYNLRYLKDFNIFIDLKVMIMTVLAVCGKEYKQDVDSEINIAVKEEVK